MIKSLRLTFWSKEHIKQKFFGYNSKKLIYTLYILSNTMESICLKMEENMLKDMDNALKNNWYSTRTEFIRAAIREKLSEIEREEAIKKLAAMRGSLKGKRKTNMTEEQVREKVGREIAKKHGIKLD